MPVETGTTTGTSASSGGGSSGGQGGQNNGLTKGYVGAPGTNNGAWSGDGVNLGLTTGTTWYGNTAFGPAGGMATGYATRDGQSLEAAGMGPTMGTYSNFNTLNGQPMFGGALGGQGFNGMNANQAYAAAQTWYNQLRDYMQARRPGDVQTAPLPPMRPVPTALPVQQPPLAKSMMPALFGGVPQQPPVGGMPVGYDPLRAAVAPDYSRNMTRNASNYNNPAYGGAARGTMGNYGATTDGWGPGTGRQGGYNAGGASYGF